MEEKKESWQILQPNQSYIYRRILIGITLNKNTSSVIMNKLKNISINSRFKTSPINEKTPILTILEGLFVIALLRE